MSRKIPAAITFVLLLPFLLPLLSPAQSATPGFHMRGMISGWSTARLDTTFEPIFSLRFIPEATWALKLGRGITLGAEASANAFGSAFFFSEDTDLAEGDVKPYRGWLRLSTSRFEARVGLQKLSFGSAALFRPLMWFDSLDPRDPLQITDGVYGLLLRYYTKGNANFWAWGLYGNDERRGFDLAPPDEKTPEFGGRVQVPLFKGEIAATYHRRKAVIDGLVPILDSQAPLSVPPVPEDRFAIDGKWDAGVGLWLEGVLVHQRTALLPLPYQRALTVGLDYTFALGRGLNVLAEQFWFESSAEAFGPGEGVSFSGLLLRYPLGILDEITGIFYYDWKNDDVYRFAGWQRTYDSFSLNLMVFWNPEELRVFQGQPSTGSFAGTGFQLLLAFYF